MIPIFKLPLFLYGIGLGWVLGKRFMCLTQTGRHSGKVRRTILAVLRYDNQTHEVMVISAWPASEWYHNIQVSPPLLLEIDGIRFTPAQRTLSPEEIAALFVDYRQKHPIFARVICQIPGWKWNSSFDEFLELARTIRGIAFRPQVAMAVEEIVEKE